MYSPILLLASLCACIYSISCLYKSYRDSHLASPHSLYAALACLHFFIPGVFVGVGFASGFVSYRNGHYALMAILFALLGLIAFQAGSISACKRVVLRRWQSHGTPYNSRRWQVSRFLILFIVLSTIGWLSRVYIISCNAYFQIDRAMQGELQGPFYAVIRMLELFPLHLVCLLSIKFWGPSGKSSLIVKRLLIICVVAEALYWLPSGRKEGVILTIILPLIIRYLIARKLPSPRAIFLFIAFIVLFFPLSFIYRRGLENGGAFTSVSDIWESVCFAFMGAGSEKNALEILMGRLSLLESLCTCIRIWEQDIWEPMLGNSYFSVLLGLIPRFIWAEKPDFHYGNEFGYVGDFISSSDFRTSISVTFFGEAYLNFGFAGFIPLFLMGAAFGFLYRNIFTSKRYETSVLLYLIATPTLLYVGGTFGLYFGGLIKLIPFYYIMGKIIEIRPKRILGRA